MVQLETAVPPVLERSLVFEMKRTFWGGTLYVFLKEEVSLLIPTFFRKFRK